MQPIFDEVRVVKTLMLFEEFINLTDFLRYFFGGL